MADEPKVDASVADPKVTEPVVEEPKVEVPPDPVEVSARAKGWKPQVEYKGDRPWVDARTFLDREPLIERISGQSKTIADLKRTVESMAKFHNKRVEHEVNAKITELQYQKKEAIKSGDVAQVEAIDAAIDHQKTIKADVPTKADVAPEVTAWVEANPWYVKDPELRDFARAYNESYLTRNPGALEDSLRKTAEATKKAFPDKFPAPPKGNGERPPAPPTVEGGTAPAGGSRKYTVGRLTSDQKLAHDQYIKAGTFDKAAKEAKMTATEYYVKSLDEIGELTR